MLPFLGLPGPQVVDGAVEVARHPEHGGIERQAMRVPERTARKRERIADPQSIDFRLTLSQAPDRTDDDPRLVEPADKSAAHITRTADEQGEFHVDDTGIELTGLLKNRSWTGRTKLERVNPARNAAGTRQQTLRCGVSRVSCDGA